MTEERRKFLRINDTSMVSYTVVNALLGMGTRLKNVSESGICIPSMHAMAPGICLEVTLHFSQHIKPMKVVGKVIWNKPRAGDIKYPFELGIVFTKISPVDQEKLLHYIKILSPRE
jgi:hypothetical protein